MDLIDRQQAIDAIVNCTNCGDEKILREYVAMHNLDNMWSGGILEALDAVKDLPSPQPYTAEEIQKVQELVAVQIEKAYELGRESVQPTGTWLIHKWGDDAQCSNCGRSFKDVYDMDNYDQYCRHCGTHMKGIKAI